MSHRHIEQADAVAALARCGNSKRKAAADLGISKRCLDMKLEGWDIARNYREHPGPKEWSTKLATIERRRRRRRSVAEIAPSGARVRSAA